VLTVFEAQPGQGQAGWSLKVGDQQGEQEQYSRIVVVVAAAAGCIHSKYVEAEEVRLVR
jgi:hypothetical protein